MVFYSPNSWGKQHIECIDIYPIDFEFLKCIWEEPKYSFLIIRTFGRDSGFKFLSPRGRVFFKSKMWILGGDVMCTLLEVDPLIPFPFDFAMSKSLGTSICSFGYAFLKSWVNGLFEATMCFWVCTTCGGFC